MSERGTPNIIRGERLESNQESNREEKKDVHELFTSAQLDAVVSSWCNATPTNRQFAKVDNSAIFAREYKLDDGKIGWCRLKMFPHKEDGIDYDSVRNTQMTYAYELKIDDNIWTTPHFQLPAESEAERHMAIDSNEKAVTARGFGAYQRELGFSSDIIFGQSDGKCPPQVLIVGDPYQMIDREGVTIIDYEYADEIFPSIQNWIQEYANLDVSNSKEEYVKRFRNFWDDLHRGDSNALRTRYPQDLLFFSSHDTWWSIFTDPAILFEKKASVAIGEFLADIVHSAKNQDMNAITERVQSFGKTIEHLWHLSVDLIQKEWKIKDYVDDVKGMTGRDVLGYHSDRYNEQDPTYGMQLLRRHYYVDQQWDASPLESSPIRAKQLIKYTALFIIGYLEHQRTVDIEDMNDSIKNSIYDPTKEDIELFLLEYLKKNEQYSDIHDLIIGIKNIDVYDPTKEDIDKLKEYAVEICNLYNKYVNESQKLIDKPCWSFEQLVEMISKKAQLESTSGDVAVKNTKTVLEIYEKIYHETDNTDLKNFVQAELHKIRAIVKDMEQAKQLKKDERIEILLNSIVLILKKIIIRLENKSNLNEKMSLQEIIGRDGDVVNLKITQYCDNEFLRSMASLEINVELGEFKGFGMNGRIVNYLNECVNFAQRAQTYAQEIFPRILEEKQRMQTSGASLESEVEEWYFKHIEQSLIQSFLFRRRAHKSVAIHGFFPSVGVPEKQYDRIVGLYSLSTHVWDTFSSVEDFKKNIEDSLRYLKPGGKLIFGPINWQRVRAIKANDYDWKSAPSKVGDLLIKALQEFKAEGVIDWAIPLFDEKGSEMYDVLDSKLSYQQYLNDSDENGFSANSVVITRVDALKHVF